MVAKEWREAYNTGDLILMARLGCPMGDTSHWTNVVTHAVFSTTLKIEGPLESCGVGHLEPPRHGAKPGVTDVCIPQ